MDNENLEPDRERWKADTYVEDWRGILYIMNNVFPRFEEVFTIPKGGWVMEIGIGSGKWSAAFAVAGCNVVAVDYLPEMLDNVIKNYPAISRGMFTVLDDARTLNRVPNNFFSVVLSEGLLEHFLDDETRLLVVKNMVKKLRGGGVFICIVPINSDEEDEHYYTKESFYEELMGTGYFSSATMLGFLINDTKEITQIGFIAQRAMVEAAA